MKVMTIVGTRPEIIKLSCVMQELDKHVDHVLVHTGQNHDYELNEIFFNEMGLRKPDVQLHTSLGFTAMGAIGNMLSSIDDELELHKPDAVLILGDTNSAVATAYAAKRRHIPIFHMEAGNRCFDDRVPEEVNRRIVDHISDINMPYTEHARRNLLAEGVAPDRIVKTGSPMSEVLGYYHEQIEDSNVLVDLGLLHHKYFVVSAHREENVDNPSRLGELSRVIANLCANYEWPVVVSLHPRTKARMATLPRIRFDDRAIVHEPFGFFDYAKLQQHAACVISDSGTITEESTLLNFPAVTIRQAHERPEGSDEGALIMSDLDQVSVLTSVNAAMKLRTNCTPSDYMTGPVSQKVVKTILSYTGYVRRTVWRQY